MVFQPKEDLGLGCDSEIRFPLTAVGQQTAIRGKNPYISMIYKDFFFLGPARKSIAMQAGMTLLVTHFGPTENRSLIRGYCIVL